MKETVESVVIMIVCIFASEVVNELCGYKLIDVKWGKNTIK